MRPLIFVLKNCLARIERMLARMFLMKVVWNMAAIAPYVPEWVEPEWVRWIVEIDSDGAGFLIIRTSVMIELMELLVTGLLEFLKH